MTDDPVVTRLTRGRPRLEQPMYPISTRLPQPAIDQLVRLASQHRMPVSHLTRQLLMVCLRNESTTN